MVPQELCQLQLIRLFHFDAGGSHALRPAPEKTQQVIQPEAVRPPERTTDAGLFIVCLFSDGYIPLDD